MINFFQYYARLMFQRGLPSVYSITSSSRSDRTHVTFGLSCSPDVFRSCRTHILSLSVCVRHPTTRHSELGFKP
jgi:hypothetical protein